MNKIDDKNFRDFVQHGDTMVQFSATWCGPCKTLTRTLEAADDLPVKIAKVDIDESPQMAAEFNIRSVPTVVVFKEGAEVARTSGAKPLNTIKTFLNESLA